MSNKKPNPIVIKRSVKFYVPRLPDGTLVKALGGATKNSAWENLKNVLPKLARGYTSFSTPKGFKKRNYSLVNQGGK